MKEFNFRAYIDKKFHYFDLEDLKQIAYTVCLVQHQEGHVSSAHDKKLFDWIEHDNQPDMFTGFKSKKGKGIYDGDILRIEPYYDDLSLIDIKLNESRSYFTAVEWHNGAFWAHCRESETPYTILGDALDCWDLDDMCYEIVGNIHENAHLLEK